MEERKNIIIQIIRMGLGSVTPFQFKEYEEIEANKHILLVSILNASTQTTSSPFNYIVLDYQKTRIYNSILKKVKEINFSFFNENGYVQYPYLYNKKEKEELTEKIMNIGHLIYSLFVGSENPLYDWLNEKFTKSKFNTREQLIGDEYVTLVTNDFTIPWYWIKREPLDGTFLCELANIGLKHLDLVSERERVEQIFGRVKIKKESSNIRNVFINGSPNLPFSKQINEDIIGMLNSRSISQRLSKTFRKNIFNYEVSNMSALRELDQEVNDDEEIIEQFKIIHFSGHYDGKQLLINDRKIKLYQNIGFLVRDSILILDGCSSGKSVSGTGELKENRISGSGDIQELTTRLLGLGALCCLVTILPIKDDPILLKSFWASFYKELFNRDSSVGISLKKARMELKKELDNTGNIDPIWLFSQLIGNPSYQLVEDRTIIN